MITLETIRRKPLANFFRPGFRYRNRNCTDIDFNVHQVLGETSEYISMLVTYWNRRGFPQGSMEAVEVQKSDLQHWHMLEKFKP